MGSDTDFGVVSICLSSGGTVYGTREDWRLGSRVETDRLVFSLVRLQFETYLDVTGLDMAIVGHSWSVASPHSSFVQAREEVGKRYSSFRTLQPSHPLCPLRPADFQPSDLLFGAPGITTPPRTSLKTFRPARPNTSERTSSRSSTRSPVQDRLCPTSRRRERRSRLSVRFSFSLSP